MFLTSRERGGAGCQTKNGHMLFLAKEKLPAHAQFSGLLKVNRFHYVQYVSALQEKLVSHELSVHIYKCQRNCPSHFSVALLCAGEKPAAMQHGRQGNLAERSLSSLLLVTGVVLLHRLFTHAVEQR